MSVNQKAASKQGVSLALPSPLERLSGCCALSAVQILCFGLPRMPVNIPFLPFASCSDEPGVLLAWKDLSPFPISHSSDRPLP